MKQYTEKQIEETREYFEKNKYRLVSENVGNRTIQYYVLPSKLCEELPNFVFRMTGDSDKGLFGISEDVHEKVRKYAVGHEVIEFMEIGINAKDRCVQALEKELELVPLDARKNYIQMRKNFFANLIPYCEKHPEDYTPEDIKEFGQSWARLNDLVEELK